MTATRSVSVVVPTHDRPHLLAETMRTILRQREVELEVVVVDDGSAVAAQAVVPALHDGRVRVVRHDAARGHAAARNTGISAASGHWIAFCDDDDLWSPTKLTQQLAATQTNGRGWGYGGVVHVDDALTVLRGEPPPSPEQLVADLARWDTVPAGASNVIVHRDALAEAGGFDERFRHLGDWDLWLRLARGGLPARVAAPVVAYRLHAGAMSLDAGGLVAEIALLEANGAAVDRAAFLRWVAERCLQAGRVAAGVSWLGRAAISRPPRPAEVVADVRMVAAHVRDRRPARACQPRPPLDPWQAEAQRWLAEVPS